MKDIAVAGRDFGLPVPAASRHTNDLRHPQQ